MLKDRLRGPAISRRLALQAQRGGDEGRVAAERLGQSDRPRPQGPLLWLHAPDGIEPGALESVVNRLIELVPDASALLTAPPGQRPPADPAAAAALICKLAPLDSIRPAARFLDHWRPDAAVWLGRIDAPVLLESAAARDIPLFFQNAVLPPLHGPRARNAHRRLLGLFERILVPDPDEADRIRGLGAIHSRIEVTGPLSYVDRPLPFAESERNALSKALRARPVWMAACPVPDEIAAITAAHREAQRVMHRLLLIIVPPVEAQAPALAAALTEQGWRVARRDANEDPDESTEIFIADYREEMGLFYRLAPVTFLGGTFARGPVPPAIEPAALGSAIIAGPHFGAEVEVLERLHRAGAARVLPTSERLGAAVADLLSPEKAAQVALRGWDIASAGSVVLDRLMGSVAHALHESQR